MCVVCVLVCVSVLPGWGTRSLYVGVCVLVCVLVCVSMCVSVCSVCSVCVTWVGDRSLYVGVCVVCVSVCV